MPEPFSPLPLMPPWAFPDPMKQDPLSRHLRDRDDPHGTMSKVAEAYQPKLTAGANITISEGNVISSASSVTGAVANGEELAVTDGMIQIGAVVRDVSGKLDNPSGGEDGQVLMKTSGGVAWARAVELSISGDGVYTLTVADGATEGEGGGEIVLPPSNPSFDPDPAIPEIGYGYDPSDADVSFEHVLAEPLTLRYVDASGDAMGGVADIGTTTVS